MTAAGLDTAWRDWPGGDCPVAGDVLVTVELRHDNFKRAVADGFPPERAGNFRWDHLGGSGDIVAYRVARP